MLLTKCIFAPVEESDGYRVSVMSRHTLNDGVTPDLRITDDSFHEWNRALAPPDRLVGAYYRRDVPWETFERLYCELLLTHPVAGCVQELVELAKQSRITVLCAEETPERCHRRLLAEHCKKLDSGLEVIVR